MLLAGTLGGPGKATVSPLEQTEVVGEHPAKTFSQVQLRKP